MKKVLSAVFVLAAIALLAGAFSPAIAPGECEGCSACVACVQQHGPFGSYGECLNLCSPMCLLSECQAGEQVCTHVRYCDGEG
jgi:hypothetical protein